MPSWASLPILSTTPPRLSRRRATAPITPNVATGNNSGQQPDTDVATGDIEAPNNNSGKQVDHLAINVSGGIEVYHNSGLQPATHVATSDIDSSNNILGQQPATHVAAGDIEASNNNISGQQDSNNDSGWTFSAFMSAFMAAANTVTGILSIVFNPPSSNQPLYSVAVGTVVIAGILHALDAILVAYSAPRRLTRRGRIFESIIQFISFATVIFGIMLDVYAYNVKK